MLRVGAGIGLVLALIHPTGAMAQSCTAKPGLGHAKLVVEMDRVMSELGSPFPSRPSPNTDMASITPLSEPSRSPPAMMRNEKPEISKAPFVVLPTDEIMNGFYPPDMKARHVSAVVGVACQFNENGAAMACAARGAYPAACGFEEATVTAVQQYVKIDASDPKLHTPGAWRYLQYYWNAPGADGSSFVQYVTGDWKYPKMRDVFRLIPEAAQKQEIEGWAKVDCAVDPTGSVYECRVIDEEPKGYVYGLVVASAFIKFASVDPGSIPGGIPSVARRKFTYKVSY